MGFKVIIILVTIFLISCDGAGEKILGYPYSNSSNNPANSSNANKLTKVHIPLPHPLGGASDSYSSYAQITFSVNPKDASVIYTFDGQDPIVDKDCNPVHGEKVLKNKLNELFVIITKNTIVKAIGCKVGLKNSDLLEREYFISKEIFVTEQGYTGFAIGGIAGADKKCNNEGYYDPNGSPLTYKALLVTNDKVRDINNDWPLKTSTEYFFVNKYYDAIYLFEVNKNNIFDFNSSKWNYSMSESSTSKEDDTYWTGLDKDWQVLNTCNNWTNSSGRNIQGSFGSANSTDYKAIAAGDSLCSEKRKLLCVEQ